MLVAQTYKREEKVICTANANSSFNWLKAIRQSLQVDQTFEFVHIVSRSQQLFVPSDALSAPATLSKKRWRVLWLSGPVPGMTGYR